MKRYNFFRASLFRMMIFVLLTTFAFADVSAAAEASPQQEPLPSIPSAAPPERQDPWSVQQRQEMQKKQNLQRQEDIKRDTEKLLELSTELKQYVDKTNENIISLDVIKKADQIEKLAKSVKEKMKGMN